MARAIQRFEVSLKAFIMRDGAALFVRETDSGYWELPGGRIDVGEEFVPHDLILAREIGEELGPAIKVEVTTAAVTWTRQRPIDGVFQFIIARMCRYLSGEIILSAEHDELTWRGSHAWRDLPFPPQSDYEIAVAELWRIAPAGKAGA